MQLTFLLRPCMCATAQDKKRRQYVVTALADTKIDLKGAHEITIESEGNGGLAGRLPGLASAHKCRGATASRILLKPPLARPPTAVLSARLGTGKGGVSWCSEEALASTLQVELGCVTPLALANASAAGVGLLLDQKLRDAGAFFVHPIVNTASVKLDAAGLEAFVRCGVLQGGGIVLGFVWGGEGLREGVRAAALCVPCHMHIPYAHPACPHVKQCVLCPFFSCRVHLSGCRGIGREPLWVDLELDPKIDKDNPPDLKQFADTLPAPPAEESSADGSQASGATTTAAVVAGAAAAVATGVAAAAGGKKAKGASKASSKAAAPAVQSDALQHVAITNVPARTEALLDTV